MKDFQLLLRLMGRKNQSQEASIFYVTWQSLKRHW